jgi:hypothetical protein
MLHGQKPPSLMMGFEPTHYFPAFSGRPVRHFDRVVSLHDSALKIHEKESFVVAMVRVWCQCFDWLDMAA